MSLAREPRDFGQSVARGNIDGYIGVNKYGRNPDIDAAAAGTLGRDIWDGGIASAAMWVPPTVTRTHAIVSSDDEDGGAGTDTGALTLRMYGLGSAYELQQEDITLNGTTPINTASTYTMIHRMYVLTAGSAGKNIGNITATAATDTTVTAKITANNCQTGMAIYQIPAGYTGYMSRTYASLHKKAVAGTAIRADTALMIKEFGGVWRLQDSLAVSSNSAPTVVNIYKSSLKLPEKTYVKMIANPSVDAQDISAGFSIVLVSDDADVY